MTSDLHKPLAAKMRPQFIDDIYGQDHLLGTGKPLRLMYEKKLLHSMILWGPPGCGKTSLAQCLAKNIDADFYKISAVLAGVKEIRDLVTKAEQNKKSGVLTVVFVDEVHRFNKAQQDAFLPHVEEGLFLFIGATTENPSFELNSALLSRARLYVLKHLEQGAILACLEKALKLESQELLGLTAEQKKALAAYADGDMRRALTALEIILQLVEHGKISDSLFEQALATTWRRFDKGGDEFHHQISALHKSVRGSDCDASLYWLTRMLDGGADPRYIARRMIRMATEDIGNADPRALQISLDAWQAWERLGSPEGDLALCQAILYLASAPKSNAVYLAFNQCKDDVKKYGSLEVPEHLRNAPTKLMKALSYGKEYKYPHDYSDAYVPKEHYFPQRMPKTSYYTPVTRGFEVTIKARLDYLKAIDEKKK